MRPGVVHSDGKSDAPAGAGFRRLAGPAVVTALLAVFCFQAVFSMRLLNAAHDETSHLPSGYTYLKTGSFRLNPQHPPLIKLLCAAPLLWLAPQLDLGDPAWQWPSLNEWTFGANFLYSNDADRLLFWGRLPVVLLALLLGAYVYRWARDLFGVSAGLMALFLYAFCPNVIAHSRLVTMDLGLSCFFVIALYYLWRYCRRGGTGNLTAAGLGLGLALATKFSAVVLLPIFFLLLGLAALMPLPGGARPTGARTGGARPGMLDAPFSGRERSARLRAAAGAFLVTVGLASMVTYAAYAFPSDPLFYWNGMMLVHRDHDPAYAYYLLGDFKQGGWWYYFVAAYAVKTPAVVLALLVVAAVRWGCERWPQWLDLAFIVLPGMVLFVFTSALAHSVGLRYILPVYPLTFIFVSRLAPCLFQHRARRAVAVLVAAWVVVGTVRVYPDYMGYFNEFVGGVENGYKALDDSNVDWGTDLRRLKVYMERHGIPTVRLYYSWNASPEYYGLNFEPVTEREWEEQPLHGVYAISVQELIYGLHSARTRGVRTDWIDRYKVLDRVGGFYLFKFVAPTRVAMPDARAGVE